MEREVVEMVGGDDRADFSGEGAAGEDEGGVLHMPPLDAKRMKVFWFFFSKKNNAYAGSGAASPPWFDRRFMKLCAVSTATAASRQ